MSTNLSKKLANFFTRIQPKLYFTYRLTVKAALCYGFYKYILPRSYSEQYDIYAKMAGCMLLATSLTNLISYKFEPCGTKRNIPFKVAIYSLLWPAAINILLIDPIRFVDSTQDTLILV